MTSLSPENVDGSEFIGLFLKMFNETKYNLQALNKRIECMEKCINNVLLLNGNEPFDEEEENDLDISPEEMQLIAENYLGKDESKDKRTPKKNKKKVVNKSSSPVDSNSPGDIINSKVNPEKKVMKYSEFLKMKQKKKAEKLSEDNKLEKRIEELSYKGSNLFNSNNNNGDDNSNNNNNDNGSSVPMINLNNFNADDINNYIDSLEKSNNLLNIKRIRK